MNGMQLGIALETRIFLLAVITGVGLGAVYDIFRAVRVVLPKIKPIVFVFDFVYMLIFGFVLFTFSTELTGSVRAFSLGGMFMGAFLERLTAGNVVVLFVSMIAAFVKKYLIQPTVVLITKFARKIRGIFVKKCSTFADKSKKCKKVLKV